MKKRKDMYEKNETIEERLKLARNYAFNLNNYTKAKEILVELLESSHMKNASLAISTEIYKILAICEMEVASVEKAIEYLLIALKLLEKVNLYGNLLYIKGILLYELAVAYRIKYEKITHNVDDIKLALRSAELSIIIKTESSLFSTHMSSNLNEDNYDIVDNNVNGVVLTLLFLGELYAGFSKIDDAIKIFEMARCCCYKSFDLSGLLKVYFLLANAYNNIEIEDSAKKGIYYYIKAVNIINYLNGDKINLYEACMKFDKRIFHNEFAKDLIEIVEGESL